MKEPRYKFLGVFYFRNYVLLIAGLVLSSFPVAAQNRALVHVTADATVGSDRIDLGRISQISGEAVASERLKGISLGYSPAIGMTREITRNQLLLSIRAAGFADENVALDSPDKVTVRRLGQTVFTSQIREAVEKAVTAQFTATNVSAQITRLDLPELVEVPIGQIEIKASISGIRSLFERFSIPVEIRVDNKLVRSFPATLEVTAYADILVASSDIAVNKLLAGSDVRLEKTRIDKPVYTYFRNIEGLRGMQVVKQIASGKPITTDSLVAGNVIKFGDPVRIEARSGRIKIVIAGEARSQGRIGDRIAVRNLQSGAIMQAIILDEGLVRVTF